MSTVNASVQGLLGLLQLGQRVRAADTVEALGFVAVNETRAVLAYRQAALWSTSAQNVVALSGVPQVERDAPYVQWLTRLCRAITPVNAPRLVEPAELSPLLAEEWPNWLPQALLVIPLAAPLGGVRGVLLLARDQHWTDDERGLAGELGALFGHALLALRPREPLWRRLGALLRQRHMWWKVALALLVVCVIPVHLSALAQAEVTPIDPFVVRTPLDGVIDRMQVKPNQPVKAGQLLFNLDATTLSSRYDTARKAYAAAQEEYQQSAQQAVTDDKSRLEMAERRGDLAQRAVDMSFAASQLARVQVKAEREGVAVFSDVNDWTGKAVSVGEKVLVLADPGKVELTGYLPVANQIALKPGSEVVFYPNGSPFTAYHAQVISVAYRAAPTDEAVLAYRVKAQFTAGEAVPRLGSMGTARFYAERVPLIYYLLRRPLAGLRQWLG